MQIYEPKGWRRLHNKAQRERDPRKLALIIDQLNQLLSEHEKTADLENANSCRVADDLEERACA